MRILIVEDDDSVAGALAEVLKSDYHDPIIVSRGDDALLHHRDADVILLDLGLPDIDGLSLLSQIRLVSEVPIIIVTAHGDERSTVRGLRLGADDYLIKPVRVQELLARIDVVARRQSATSHSSVIHVDDVQIDVEAREVLTAHQVLRLTQIEFDLLATLAKRCGKPVRREAILDEVWGDVYPGTSRCLDVHIAQLRHKLNRPGLITTVRGYGYKLGG